MAQATTAELITLLAPFVGAKLNRARDAKGYVLPQTLATDILHRCNSVNADVRSVTAEGVEVQFGGFLQFIRWTEVQSITIRSLGADGNTTAATVYEHDRLPALSKGQRVFAAMAMGEAA